MTPEIPLSARIRYIDRRLKEIVECRIALQNHDLSISQRIGHQMKGNASTFGFEALEDIAKDLERAAVAKDIHNINSRLDDIEKRLIDFQKSL